MVARLTSQFLVLVIVALLHRSVSANVPPSTLARFNNGEHSLQNLIKFPAVDGDVSKVIHCTSVVDKNGKLRSTWCPAASESDRRFIKAIETAVRKTRVFPATVNGEAHRTNLYYRVSFVKKQEIEGIAIYPNWGHDVDRYGTDYESSQRYGRIHSRCVVSPLLLATVTIQADGQAAGPVSFSGGGAHYQKSPCAGHLRKAIVRGAYIAGRHDGKPVETTVVIAIQGFVKSRYHPVIGYIAN